MALPIAIQLYGVRDFMEKDAKETLRQIAAMRYEIGRASCRERVSL